MPYKAAPIVLFLFINISPVKTQPAEAIPVLNYAQLEPLLYLSNDTTYIINFWATWCIPCRKELPEFERIHAENANSGNVKVLLVSLDFASKLESSLIPYLEKNEITAPVVLLSDPNSNFWINKVDPSWTGSLPATIIYKGDQRRFFEQELDYTSINNTISELNKL
jgi:thiol-disulfide isomerase/thioredoxin